MLAPFLLAGILFVASDERIMQGQCGSLATRGVVAVATVLMFGAAAALFVF